MTGAPMMGADDGPAAGWTRRKTGPQGNGRGTAMARGTAQDGSADGRAPGDGRPDGSARALPAGEAAALRRALDTCAKARLLPQFLAALGPAELEFLRHDWAL